MTNSSSNLHATAKHTLTVLHPVYEAVKKSAERRGLDPHELMTEMIVEAVIKDGTLDEYTSHRFNLGRSLTERVVEAALDICRQGKFSEHIILNAIQNCTLVDEWANSYRLFIEDDIFKHGNPLKAINKEFGYRIRAAIGGRVKKNSDGKPVTAKVSGEIIQSYTLMDDYDRKRF